MPSSILRAVLATILFVVVPIQLGLSVVERVVGDRPIEIVATGAVHGRVRRCGCKAALEEGSATKAGPAAGCSCRKRKRFQSVVQVAKARVEVADPGALPERSSWLAQRRSLGSSLLQVDSGDLLFPGPLPGELERPEWRRRADLLVEAYGDLGVGAYVPGETDFALGRAELEAILGRAPFPVLAANLLDAQSGRALFAATAVVEVGGVRVGIVGIFDPSAGVARDSLLAREGLRISDPRAAASKAVASLRGKVDLVLLLAHQPDAAARALVKAVPGIDVVVDSYPDEPSNATSAFEGRTGFFCPEDDTSVLHLRTRVVPGGRGIGETRPREEARSWVQRIGDQIARQEAERREAVDPAKKTYLDGQIAFARTELAKSEAVLAGEPCHEVSVLEIPLDGATWTRDQDARLLAAIDRYKADVEALVPDPALVAKLEAEGRHPGGEPLGFQTAARCEGCHPKQAAVWRASVHAGAWDVLVKGQNTRDPACVRCHSLGFREPGGYAQFKRVERQDEERGLLNFRGVQCEACHGARLGHPVVKGLGVSKPGLTECRRCHDGLHDPSFDQAKIDEAMKSARPPCVAGRP